MAVQYYKSQVLGRLRGNNHSDTAATQRLVCRLQQCTEACQAWCRSIHAGQSSRLLLTSTFIVITL